MDGDGLFWASDHEISVFLAGLPNDSAFLKPLVGAVERRASEAEEAQKEIMESIGAPTF